MKKILAVALAAVMVLSLAACGAADATPEQKEVVSEAVAAAEAAKEVVEEKAAEASAEVEDDTAATQKFIMGIDPEYPPFSYLGDDGEYTGFDVEVCQAACEKLGWDFEVFGVNWDEKLVQLDSNECDCVWSGMTILDSMKEAGYIISKPYYDNRQVLLVKDESGIKSSADLAGKSVAVQLGTSGEALLNEDLADLAATFGELVTCDSFLKCFTELDGGAVDAVFVDLPVAKSYVEGKTGYTIIDEDLGVEQYGIAFRSGDQALCDAMDGAVQDLVKDGTYAQIADKYPDIKENLLFLQ